MVVFLERSRTQFAVSNKTVYDSWSNAVALLGVTDEAIGSDLFNLQVAIKANALAYNGRSSDFVIATLNDLGFTIATDDIPKPLEKSNAIERRLGDAVKTNALTAKGLAAAPLVNEFAVRFWLEQDKQRQE